MAGVGRSRGRRGVGRLVARERAAEERGFPGFPRTARSQPASSELEGSRGTVLAELPDGFLPRQDELASHAAYISLTASLNGVWFDVTSSSVANEGFFPTRGYDDYSFRTFRSGLIEPF